MRIGSTIARFNLSIGAAPVNTSLCAAHPLRLALGLVAAGALVTSSSSEAQERAGHRTHLEAVRLQLEAGDLPLPDLTAIAKATGSNELGSLLEDLSQLRREVGELRTRYTDEYPGLQSRMSRVARIESYAVPQLVEHLLELAIASEQLRALRDRYTEDYPPIQTLLRQIEVIETVSIPSVVEEVGGAGAAPPRA